IISDTTITSHQSLLTSYSLVAHRNLHSFPTRRSSDLKKGIINSKNTGKKYNRAWSSNVKADKEPVCRFSDITTNNHACEPPNAPDRKSTRLNSSHVKISYAVFCLKKKKKNKKRQNVCI